MKYDISVPLALANKTAKIMIVSKQINPNTPPICHWLVKNR